MPGHVSTSLRLARRCPGAAVVSSCAVIVSSPFHCPRQMRAFSRTPPRWSHRRARISGHGRSCAAWCHDLSSRYMDGRRSRGRAADLGHGIDRLQGHHARHVKSVQLGWKGLYHPRASTARAPGPSCRPPLGIRRSARSMRHALPHSVPASRWLRQGDIQLRICRVTRSR